jgi:hypothetical protein
MWQKIKLFKSTLFVNWLFGSFFWENGLETNQDGIRFEISLQKSKERNILLQKSMFSQCFRLQARLKKLKCKNFPIFKISNLWKTQHFQNSLKIWVFILETYVKRKSCYKLHKESQKKKLAGIGEPMIPTFGGLANIDPHGTLPWKLDFLKMT